MPLCRPEEFVAVVRPHLETQDVTALAQAVCSRWTSQDICPLLFATARETRQVACVVLGLVGDRGCVGCLARALHDPCRTVSGFAEHALWSVWFRLGSPAATESFQAGADLLCADQPKPALACFKQAIAADSTFAEAYNQAAICLYMLGMYEPSMAFCNQALCRMPMHFGAVSGKGHALIHLGRVEEAVKCYRQALDIHPHLDEIGEALAQYAAPANKPWPRQTGL